MPLPNAPSSLAAHSTNTQPPAAPAPYPMITRARASVYKPNPCYALTNAASDISPIPSFARAALKDPQWRVAMAAKFAAL